MTKEKILINVYSHISIEITIDYNKNTYTYKTPKFFGGRFYYQFSNDVDNAFEEQYPFIYKKINK